MVRLASLFFLVFAISAASVLDAQEGPSLDPQAEPRAPASDAQEALGEPMPIVADAKAGAGEPQGIEVQARGPVHEAFAAPATEPAASKPVPKQPPAPLNEMAPEEKPAGAVQWIGGYWAWDDDRNDFLWVSGTWRVPPPGRQWVSGYWREATDGWQWVPGFWAVAKEERLEPNAAAAPQPNYLSAPPAAPETAAPGPAPAEDAFFVPGYWVWGGSTYAWRGGYWARVKPGYVWVPAHYRWTPAGYLFVPGYWDLVVARRGVLYAPVVVNPAVVRVSFAYTPAFVVRDTLILDTLFVRPRCGCYYFGDYYGPAYRALGYESCVVYSRRRYDPIFVYARFENRHVPNWERNYLALNVDRHAGRAPLPPRTLVQQNTIIQKNVNVTNITNSTNVTNTKNVTNIQNRNRTVNASPGIVPARQALSATGGAPAQTLDAKDRQQARQQATKQQRAAERRAEAERSAATRISPAGPGTPGGASARPAGPATTDSAAQPPRSTRPPTRDNGAEPAIRRGSRGPGERPSDPATGATPPTGKVNAVAPQPTPARRPSSPPSNPAPVSAPPPMRRATVPPQPASPASGVPGPMAQPSASPQPTPARRPSAPPSNPAPASTPPPMRRATVPLPPASPASGVPGPMAQPTATPQPKGPTGRPANARPQVPPQGKQAPPKQRPPRESRDKPERS